MSKRKTALILPAFAVLLTLGGAMIGCNATTTDDGGDDECIEAKPGADCSDEGDDCVVDPEGGNCGPEHHLCQNQHWTDYCEDTDHTCNGGCVL
jgi:hypothetical protein